MSVLCDEVSLSTNQLGHLSTHPEEQEYSPSINCSVVYEETKNSHGLLVGVQQAFCSTDSACTGVLVCEWQLHAAVDLRVNGE